MMSGEAAIAFRLQPDRENLAVTQEQIVWSAVCLPRPRRGRQQGDFNDHPEAPIGHADQIALGSTRPPSAPERSNRAPRNRKRA